MERSIISSTSTCCALTRALSHLFGEAGVPSLKAQSFAALLSHLKGWQPGSLNLDPNFTADVLSSPLGLRLLHRACVLIPLVSRLTQCPIGIDLSVNQLLGKSELRAVLPKLQAVSLIFEARGKKQKLGLSVLRAIADNCPKLRTLSLIGKEFSVKGLRQISACCTGLTSLSLRHIQVQHMKALRRVTSGLRTLSLVGAWSDASLASVLRRCRHLKSLHLEGRFGRKPARALRKAQPPLVELRLFQDEESQPLISEPRSLVISRDARGISPKDSVLVNTIQCLSGLQRLQLRDCDLVPGAIAQIMRRCSGLQSLEIKHKVVLVGTCFNEVMSQVTSLGPLQKLSLSYHCDDTGASPS